MKENTVLFVDDEIHILNALKRGLIDEEYKRIFALSGEEALKIMEETNVSVIVTDMRMPGMNGLQLLRIVKEKYPDVVKIVLTGYTQLPQILATVNQVDIFKFITKPWNMEEEFIHIIRQAVEYYNLQREKAVLQESLQKRNMSYQNILKSTEEKLVKVKKDFENVKNISLFVFTHLKNRIGKWKDLSPAAYDRMLHEINLCEKFLQEYMTTVPAEVVDFHLEKIIKDLNAYLIKQEFQHQVKLYWKEDRHLQYHGNYTLFMLVLATVIENILTDDPKSQISLTFSGEEKKEGRAINVFIDGHMHKLYDAEAMDDKPFHTVRLMLERFCSLLNGTMVWLDQDQNMILKMEVIF